MPSLFIPEAGWAMPGLPVGWIQLVGPVKVLGVVQPHPNPSVQSKAGAARSQSRWGRGGRRGQVAWH